MAVVTITDTTVDGSGTAPDAPTSLTTETEWDGVRLHWTNPSQRDVDYIEIWRNTSITFAGAVMVAQVKGNDYMDHSLETGTRYYWIRATSTTGLSSAYLPLDSDNGIVGTPVPVADVSAAVAGELLYYTGTEWGTGRSFTGANAYSFDRSTTGTGSNSLFQIGRTRTDGAVSNGQGPWLTGQYGATGRTASPITSVQMLYNTDHTTNGHQVRLVSHPDSGAGTQNFIASFKRGNHILYDTSNNETSGQNITSASFNSSGAFIAGKSAVTDYFTILSLNKRRSDVTVPVDGDRADFRIAYQGTSGVPYNVAKFDTVYDSSAGHSFSLNVFNTAGTTSLATVESTQKSTVINAIPTSGVGAPAPVASFDRDVIACQAPVSFPTYTTTERNALTPAAGWVVFNTTTVKLECYDGSAWQALF